MHGAAWRNTLRINLQFNCPVAATLLVEPWLCKELSAEQGRLNE